MRRLARRLFSLCSAASLVLCVAVCALWVRSYSTADYVLRSGHENSIEFAASRGQFLVTNETIAYPSASALRLSRGWHHFSDPAGPDDLTFLLYPPFGNSPRFASAHFGFQASNRAAGGLTLLIPFWGLGVVAGVLPAMWSSARVRRAHARRRRGRCPTCGYDLRATPGCCSECGPSAAAAVADPLGLPARACVAAAR